MIRASAPYTSGWDSFVRGGSLSMLHRNITHLKTVQKSFLDNNLNYTFYDVFSITK